MTRTSMIMATGLVGAASARPAWADGAAVSAAVAPTTAPADELDLRLTLSTFLFRESGADAPAIVDQGATLPNASPVRRTFGDLRAELATDGLTLDARVRQTTSARYQAGASGNGEYELRTLGYRLGSPTTFLTIGRQTIDAVGATRIDGLAITRKLTATVAATAFGGAYPQLGSRSLDTDYVHVRNADGSEGGLLVPVTGGVGLAYTAPELHGDLGVAAIYAAQDVGDAPPAERSRVFATSSGYWRLGPQLDAYEYGRLDLAGGTGVKLTNGSAGVDVRPIPTVQLTGSIHHVSTDVLQITARNLLADPDPSALGVVQNNLAVLRVSQDVARIAASVGLVAQRFELSAAGSVRRRPEVSVQLADGSGAVAFPEARSAEATLSILDRRSVAGLRIQLSGSLTTPLGDSMANRARGSLGRLSVSRGFSHDRGQLEVDVMAERFRDLGANSGMCMTSLDAFACYGTSTTVAAQAGAQASWRVGREWLVIADAHAGYRDVSSTGIAGPIAWPKVTSIASFIRIQWRYR